ncbi:phosphopantetheine-binding protein [Gordonia sp. VNK1]|uniref:phosphopantetheine-binding protein n=1 Tax=Gordonia oleivorans TaxID=3156618 RepID=UPI0032B6145A
MYRTGDIVRVDPTSGLLEFHGRNDDQMSVHGVRIEPAEIERLAAAVDGVDAAVAVPVHAPHGTSIEVAVTARDDVEAAALAAGVRHHLFATLPSVMWPRRVLVFDSLPLGSTGKLDRRALAEQFAAVPIAPDGYRAPGTPMEQTVAQTVSTVLEVDDPTMLASVIDLGGTSLALMEIVGALSTATGRRVRIVDITVATTPGDIAALLDATPPAATAAGTDVERHLTRTQQELWLLHCLGPAIAAYHLPVHLTFDDDVTVADLTAALGDVLAQLPVTTAALDDDAVRASATAPLDLTFDVAWRATIDDNGDHLALCSPPTTSPSTPPRCRFSLPISLPRYASAVMATNLTGPRRPCRRPLLFPRRIASSFVNSPGTGSATTRTAASATRRRWTSQGVVR